MNTFQIENKLAGVKGFRGVYPADKIPRLSRPGLYPQTIIVNLHPSHQKGLHWVAICFLRKKGKKILEYFDSYAVNLPLPLGLEWNFIQNTTKLQGNRSNVCGQYCVYFVDQRRKKSFQQIVQQLKKSANPDRLVENYVERMLPTWKYTTSLKKAQCCVCGEHQGKVLPRTLQLFCKQLVEKCLQERGRGN